MFRFDPDALRLQLGAEDAELRREAIACVPEDAGERGLDLLVIGLGDASWRVRKEAVDRLAAWPRAAAAAERLVRVVQDTDDVGLRNSALETLQRIGAPAVGVLTRALGGTAQRHRKFLLDVLGDIGDARGAPTLVRALDDDDPNVRVAAAEALGKVGGTLAERALLELVDSSDMMVQLTAIDALAELRAVVEIERIAPCIDLPVVRASALRLLGFSRDSAAVPWLVEALDHKTRRAREAATVALSKLANDLAGDSGGLRRLRDAVAALGTGTVEQVTRMLTARDPEVRVGAAHLLGLGSHRSAVEQLTAGLVDPLSGEACGRALEAMAPAVGQPLAELARSVDPVVRDELSALDDVYGSTRIEMSIEEFRALRDLVYQHCGIYVQDDQAYVIRRRLAPRVAMVERTSFADYLTLLRSGSDGRAELDEVVARITTNETYFFREAYQLRAFRDEILQQLYDQRPRGRRLRLWSAGCSTGEEAYTIAMLVRDRPAFDDWTVEILASDISPRVLEVARGGRYGPSSVRTRDLPELRRFVRSTERGYEVDPQIRHMVSFERVNLLDEEQVARFVQGGAGLDVIFCRNVIMYFDREARKRAIATFFDQLAPGGYLLLGHSESLLNLSTRFELVQLRNDTVYRKPPR